MKLNMKPIFDPTQTFLTAVESENLLQVQSKNLLLQAESANPQVEPDMALLTVQIVCIYIYLHI